MAISSATSDQALWDEYDDACTYEEQDSEALCKRFISSCVMLMRRMPEQISSTGQSTSFPGSRIENELEYARSWVRMNASTGGAIKYADFRNSRS